MADLERSIDLLAAVTLDRLVDDAALQTRDDRKYVLSPAAVAVLLTRLAGGLAVLEIEGRRRFRYDTVYFDTASYDSYLDAARGRPDRFKVRTRCYVDDHTSWIEVKQRTRRGQSEKARRSHDPGRLLTITPEAAEFLSGFDRIRPHLTALRPTLRTRYTRTTLRIGGQRVTIDRSVRCEALAPEESPNPHVGVGDRLVVETKSTGQPGPVDRTLWALGHRPARLSKYALGMATAHPGLPRNRWHRTIDRWAVEFSSCSCMDQTTPHTWEDALHHRTVR